MSRLEGGMMAIATLVICEIVKNVPEIAICDHSGQFLEAAIPYRCWRFIW